MYAIHDQHGSGTYPMSVLYTPGAMHSSQAGTDYRACRGLSSYSSYSSTRLEGQSWFRFDCSTPGWSAPSMTTYWIRYEYELFDHMVPSSFFYTYISSLYMVWCATNGLRLWTMTGWLWSCISLSIFPRTMFPLTCLGLGYRSWGCNGCDVLTLGDERERVIEYNRRWYCPIPVNSGLQLVRVGLQSNWSMYLLEYNVSLTAYDERVQHIGITTRQISYQITNSLFCPRRCPIYAIGSDLTSSADESDIIFRGFWDQISQVRKHR